MISLLLVAEDCSPLQESLFLFRNAPGKKTERQQVCSLQGTTRGQNDVCTRIIAKEKGEFAGDLSSSCGSKLYFLLL
jgi:hypothetical protein